MASFALPVSTVAAGVFPGISLNAPSLGAVVDTGATQGNTFVSFDVNGTSTGDQIAIFQSADNFATDYTLIKVFNVGALATPIQVVARYFRTYRIVGTGVMVVFLNEITSPSAPGSTGIVNGGQTGPLVIGTTDATSLTLEAGGIAQAVLGATGNSTFGSAAGADSTTLQSGTGPLLVTTGGNLNLLTTAGALLQSGSAPLAINSTGSNITVRVGAGGSIGVGDNAVAQTVNVGNQTGASATNVNGGSGGVQIDAAGAVALGGTNATSTTVGNQTGTHTASLLAGSGGLNIGVPIGVAAGVVVQGGTGISSFNVAAAGTLNLQTAAVAATTNLATGPAAQTLTAGSTNTTSTTTIRGGSGGIGIGATAPGTSGTAIDTTAAGALTIGATNATSVVTGNTATSVRLAPMTTTQRNALATSLPPTGSQVFNSTTGEPEINIGTAAAPIWAAQAAQFGGPLTLTAGAVTVTGVNLTANSTILVQVGTPNTTALTVRYDVLSGSRTNGAGSGSFTISALVAAGTLNNVDVSSGVRWAIIGQ